MGYGVQDRIEVSLFINDTEFPLDAFNVLHFLHIGWAATAILPTVHLSVADVLHALDKMELQDGIPIRLTVKPWTQDTVTFNFRKFHHRKTYNNGFFSYEMDGYLDFVPYWTGVPQQSFRGTSSDALANIAKTCGLQYQGISTSDSQLWIPRNRTYGEWATDIAWHGFVTNASCTRIGVDPQGILLYRDINNLPSPTVTLILGAPGQNAYTVMDYAPVAKSGMNNKLQGYQHTRNDQSMVGDKVFTPYNKITVTPDVTAPLWNNAVKDLAQNGYQTFGGIDVGNTHEQYEQAKYQNLRYCNLFSLDVDFLLPASTPLTLFDTFTFSVEQDNNKYDAAYSGPYIVSGKAWLVKGATFAEKIVGTRLGTNSQYISA